MLISARFERRRLQTFGIKKPVGLTSPRSRREIHLTFDDGPDRTWTPRVLEALHRSGARATFFVVTPLARRYPRLISEMLKRGHAVGFHCVEHIRHTELSGEEISHDARNGLLDLAHIGMKPQLWRTPWGITTPATLETARKFGMEIAPWTEDTHDWRGDASSRMLDSIGSSLAPGSVVLMHDGLGPGARRAGCEETISLIEPLVDHIRTLGCDPALMRPAQVPGYEVSA